MRDRATKELVGIGVPVLPFLEKAMMNADQEVADRARRCFDQIHAQNGSVLAFATSPGKTAADGAGQNGVYTGELLKAMTQPGLELEEVLKRTAEGVERASGNRQTPWYNSAFHGHFFFIGPVRVTALPPQPALSASDKDASFWGSIKTSTDPADFEDFLKRFPES